MLPPAAQGQPLLRFDSLTQTVSARGVAEVESPERALRVYFENASTPMMGDYSVDGGTLCFQPRFPLLAGKYHAVFNGARLDFRVDTPENRSTAHVSGVLPSGNTVPANHLRIYVEFSQPMSRRAVESRIQLIDERGVAVPHPFVDTRDGLWDREARRVTLILDPGRIKRGLELHETMGSPLKAGHRYRLVIPRDLEDADGLPLAEGFEKELLAAPDERAPVDPSRWVIRVPRAGTSDALVVIADRPMDEPLFERLVSVGYLGGGKSASAARKSACATSDGMEWKCTAEGLWTAGEYVLRVEAEVEDVAGNRPGRSFDEATDVSGRRKDAHPVEVKFLILER